MVRRKRFSERETIACILQQGSVIPCGKCRKAITDPDNCQREHLHQLATGGEDTVENCAYWHKTPCSHEKSFGTKATSAGSDAHIRAKAKRIKRSRAISDNLLQAMPSFVQLIGNHQARLERDTVQTFFKEPKQPKGRAAWKKKPRKS